MLKLKNLKKHFGGVKAVDNCSFEIGKGMITALIGPNGAGKSTVFNLVSGIINPDDGQIFLNGTDIANLPPETIARLGVSRLFQQSRLFKNLTVKENLLLAFDGEDTKFLKNFLGLNKVNKEKEEIIEHWLKKVELERFKNHIAGDLSYGQKRLIEIIRAIINPHSFLMLDEPVAGVNPKLRKEIAAMLLELKKSGETILLIEHDMDFTFGVADKIIVMAKGTVIAEGQPKQIRENKDVLEAYFGE